MRTTIAINLSGFITGGCRKDTGSSGNFARVWIKDTSGRYVFVNSGICQFVINFPDSVSSVLGARFISLVRFVTRAGLTVNRFCSRPVG